MRLPSTLSTVPMWTPSAPITSICSAMFCMVGSLLDPPQRAGRTFVLSRENDDAVCRWSDQRRLRRSMVIDDLPVAVLAHDDPAHLDREIRAFAGEIERDH